MEGIKRVSSITVAKHPYGTKRAVYTVFIDNAKWCVMTGDDYRNKFLPAYEELVARRTRVLSGQADVTI
jgi:hypothetical protein